MSNRTINLYHMPYEIYDRVYGLIGHSPLNTSVDNIVSDMEEARWEYYDIFWFLVYFYYEERAQRASQDSICRIKHFINQYESYLHLIRQ